MAQVEVHPRGGDLEGDAHRLVERQPSGAWSFAAGPTAAPGPRTIVLDHPFGAAVATFTVSLRSPTVVGVAPSELAPGGVTTHVIGLYIGPKELDRLHGFAAVDAPVQLDEAGNIGVKNVYWMTHETNATAIQLYERIAERPGFIQFRKGL